jgi:hypothetical protein
MTEKLIKKIKPDFVGRNIYVGLPGSEIYDQVIDEKLYEYIDEFGIAYMKGFLNNVDRYYGGCSYYKPYEDRAYSAWGKNFRDFLLDVNLRKVLSFFKLREGK